MTKDTVAETNAISSTTSLQENVATIIAAKNLNLCNYSIIFSLASAKTVTLFQNQANGDGDSIITKITTDQSTQDPLSGFSIKATGKTFNVTSYLKDDMIFLGPWNSNLVSARNLVFQFSSTIESAVLMTTGVTLNNLSVIPT